MKTRNIDVLQKFASNWTKPSQTRPGTANEISRGKKMNSIHHKFTSNWTTNTFQTLDQNSQATLETNVNTMVTDNMIHTEKL